MGDETALPAIGRRVEELRPGVPVTTLVAVKDTSERHAFATAADLRALWVERQAVGEDDAASLLRILEGLHMPEGDELVWIAAEADVARTLRRHMIEVRGHTAAWVKAAGYWVHGRDGAHEGFKGE